MATLTEKLANSNRGIPTPSAQGSLAPYLTYWLENIAVHQLRENTHTRYTAVARLYLIPGLGRKKLAKLTAKDVRTWLNQLRTTCQCCTRGLDTARQQPQVLRDRDVLPQAPLPADAGLRAHRAQVRPGARRPRRENPRNVARNVCMGTPRPRRFGPLTAEEARTFLAATSGHRLSTLFELALRTGLRKSELLGLR